uniref:CCHC-type domain-containing protein n=1 Tax=Trichuris muris TaxID=70415 RepID=A0A5S6QUQ6_TRIMR
MLARGPLSSNVDIELAAVTNTSASVALNPTADWLCFVCGGINHFARECLTRNREASTQQQDRKVDTWSQVGPQYDEES